MAVTGTDSKSTTTMMIASVVSGGGRKAIVAGNIGIPFSERVLSCGLSILVVEVSAFQLWSCQIFRPKVAMITNVAEDHLEYFDGNTGYADAKARLLRDLGHGDTAILRGDDAIVSTMNVRQMSRGTLRAPLQGQGWSLSDDALCRNGRPIFLSWKCRYLVFIVIERACSVRRGRGIWTGWAGHVGRPSCVQGLPHRFEWVRDVAGPLVQ